MDKKVVNSEKTSSDEIIEKSQKAVVFPISKLHWNACTHNPGHRDFIPLKTFNSEHLPEKYRSEDILNYILSLAALTVRIVVTVRSPERPADYLYFCGNGTLWTGTGTVTDIKPKNLKALKHFCITESTTAVISIKTACHVVFDSLEASHCYVNFFFDDEENKEGVKHVTGKIVSIKNEEEDWSIFQCHTTDVSLIKTIISNLKMISKSRYVQSLSESIAVIASHPHGMSKHISVGRWTYGSSNPCMEQRRSFSPNLSIRILDDSIKYTLFPWEPIDVLVNSSRVTDRPVQCFSEPVGIECDVHFPDGTTSKCHVWQVDRTVKYTKMSLINECGIGINVPSEQLYLELQLSNGDTQVMKDDKLLEYYWNDLTASSTIFLKISQNEL
ncbi:hypothetical protein BgiMline_031396 [Biomphalaria glabrata]|uniref:Uncharacterized protein LOC106051330 isoform X1 n=1 Tax=Biomphalaria glabrata TaxID=6526 RepID=A0A9W2YSR1_BIOGL|nr:uncharacterized protein LOC106051330 isoform X1 [Biomphalaria glabrata]XP_055865745.1 uncharacterized protein LOC106051330 isoform X1 [Biomphalaria glabrata]KAI8745915.1 hypothetical protein BgiMline_019631 [Biomphalaria glabrata]KAI8779890.1 hypothetical protein BgiBS90_019084 [Biomphalaria glabrata]